jgi:hypothetical protein
VVGVGCWEEKWDEREVGVVDGVSVTDTASACLGDNFKFGNEDEAGRHLEKPRIGEYNKAPGNSTTVRVAGKDGK